MPARIDEDTDEFDDEFADEFGDLGGDEVEASLARLEESFQSQQLPRSRQSSHQQQTVTTTTGGALKRPRIDTNGYKESLARRVATSSSSRRNAPNPGLDDFRVSHQGHVQGGSILPAGEDDFDDDAGLWGGMDLDKLETEAIELSQRSQGQTNAGRQEKRRPSPETVTRRTLTRGSKRARSGEESLESRRVDQDFKEEIEADRKRIEELERQLATKDEELLRSKKEFQAKLGEVSVLRANMNRTVIDFSSVLKEKEEAIARHKAINNEMKKMHEEQLARSETINAFKHTELATAAHWSSITASVARRRGGPGVTSSQRGNSQSQSQTVAAAVGLTTPTRRNRGSTRNLGSGEGGSTRSGEAREKGKRTPVAGEDSPSSRRSLLRQQRQNTMESAAKAKVKTPAFPGFVNSFATPHPTSKNASKSKVEHIQQENEDEDAAVFQDDPPVPRLEVETMHVDQRCGPSSSLVLEEGLGWQGTRVPERVPTGWAHPQYRYLWAVTTYSKQLSFISSLILSHSSTPCSNTSSSHSTLHSSTLYRLLNASFPAQTPLALQEQYIVTTHLLLNMLSQGSATDAENRFSYLLDKFDYEEQMDLDEEGRQKQDEEVFWACHTIINEGVSDVLAGIASVLCTMLSISLESGMVHRLFDVFVLMRSICIHQPSMIHSLLLVDSPSHSSIADGEIQSQQVEELPESGQTAPVRDVPSLILSCIQKLTDVAKEEREEDELEEDQDDEWRLGGKQAERLLRAMIGIIDVIAWEIESSNQYSSLCTHQIKRIIDEPGVVASLLNYHHREPVTMRQVISLLIRLTRHSSLWRNIVSCKIDKNLEQQQKTKPYLSRSETPLLEILARLFVDGRMKMGPKEAHNLHCDVVVLLSQLIIQHSDALVLVAESNSILAAIVKCLQLDVGLIWDDEGEQIQSQVDVHVIDIVERICLDVRLLSRLYICPKRPANLAQKLQSHEVHLLLNGIKHCFVLALSRVAFAPEPDWFDAKSSQVLATVNEIAADLLELILSPEEMESAWEMLNDDDDDDEEQEEMQEQPLPPSSPQAEEEDVESQTQMEEDDQDVILLS